MIIRCEKCDTKYRLDASMISTASVKVQCSKCAHIFIVPSVKGDNGTSDFKTGAPPSPPAPTAPSYGNFDLSPGGGTLGETKQGPGEGVETEAEAEATPETEAGPSPSQGFDMTFGAPTEAPLTDDENRENVDEKSVPVEPTPEMEVESYIAGSKEPLGEAESEKQNTAEEKKPTEAQSSRDFDLTFNSPDEAPLSQTRAETEDEKADDEAGAKTEERAVEETSGPEDSGENRAMSSTDGVSTSNFQATFNTPDKVSSGDGEVSRDFLDSEVSTDVRPEPMAKYYVDTPSPKSEDLGAQEATARTEEEQDITADNIEHEEDTSFVDELLKAETEAEKADTERASGKTATPEIDSSLVDEKVHAENTTKKSGMAKTVAIIVIILVLAGGIIYLKSRSQSPLMALPSAERTIEVESVKGYYVLNKDSGRIFVIESLIKNTTDGPVKISGIRGVVMDSSGNEMESKMVSPGRVVGAKDLRTLPVDRLLRSFRDTSESTIPKKAVIPTMILFPDLNDAVAEYGIDVLR